MKTGTVFLAFAPALVLCQNVFTIYRDEGCSTEDANAKQDIQLFEPDQPGCAGGSAVFDGWPTDELGRYIMYFNGNGIGDGCQLNLLEQSEAEPSACGIAYLVINGGTAGPCRKSYFPPNYSLEYCCTTCEIKAADSGNATAAAITDVIAVKRVNPFRKRQGDCSFEANGTPYESRAAAVVVGQGLSCPSGDTACSITRETSYTSGSSNSFGSTVEAGASFWQIISASVSFTQEYTFSEENTISTSYTISVPAGQRGFATWTPIVECVKGKFLGGGCGGWTTGEEGVACKPLYVDGNNGKEPRGIYSFVQEV